MSDFLLVSSQSLPVFSHFVRQPEPPSNRPVLCHATSTPLLHCLLSFGTVSIPLVLGHHNRLLEIHVLVPRVLCSLASSFWTPSIMSSLRSASPTDPNSLHNIFTRGRYLPQEEHFLFWLAKQSLGSSTIFAAWNLWLPARNSVHCVTHHPSFNWPKRHSLDR